MKKWLVILVGMLFLTGCGSVETYETLGDVAHLSPTAAQMQQVVLTLPQEAALAVSGGDGEVTVYECDGYMIQLQTFASGDFSKTIRALCGFDPDALTVMESACGDHTRYDWVWTAVAEEGDVVCRGAVLDDGGHHYSLCVMASAEDSAALAAQWNGLFASFCLETE